MNVSISAFLSSQSLSNSSILSAATTKRPRENEAGPSRNVSKRTGGRPLNRIDQPNQSSESRSDSPMVIPDVPTSQSSNESSHQSINRSAPARRRTRSTGPPVELEIDIDDGNNANTSQASQSMQAAPMPRHRDQRTQALTRPPTPERLRNMSPAERSQDFRNFNRGNGG